MIKTEAQHVNLCTRAIIIEDGRLAITNWKEGANYDGSGKPFMIGGRVEHGEALTTALVREVKEETGANATIKKLIYMHENIFTDIYGVETHELGYYFLVTCDRKICPGGQPSQNRDYPDLQNVLVPLTQAGLSSLYPKFLADYLPLDYQLNFSASPRMIYSRDQNPKRIAEEQTPLYFDRVNLIE